MKLGQTGAANVNTDFQGNDIVRAGDLLHVPITLWEKRKADTPFGSAYFCDFTYQGDDEAYTVVFGERSPAYRQLGEVSDSDIKEGLEVVISEAGRSFKLVEWEQDAPPESAAPVAPAAPAAPAARPARPTPAGTERPARPAGKPSMPRAKSVDDVPW